MGVLDGRVAVITGGTSGIGARTAELFAGEGATTVIAGEGGTPGGIASLDLDRLKRTLAIHLGGTAPVMKVRRTADGRPASSMCAHGSCRASQK